MVYDFGSNLPDRVQRARGPDGVGSIGTSSSGYAVRSIAQQHGDLSQYGSNNPYDNPNRDRPMVESRLIYGSSIRSNPIPESTARGLSGLYAAFQDTQGRRIGLNADALSKHLLLLGGIGTGKTNVFYFLLESVLSKQNPEDIVFIFDTKGDFYRQFYRPADPSHIVIGNGREYWNESRAWNIFGEMNLDSASSSIDAFTAKEIGKQLFLDRGSETQPFFSLAAGDLVSKVLIDFGRRAQHSGSKSFLTNQVFSQWLKRATLRDYFDLIERNPDFSGASLYFGDPSQGAGQKLSPQALGVFGYINAMANDLLTGIFEEPRPNGTFSMRSLVRNRAEHGGKRVVFIEYDLASGEVLTPIYRLLIDLALKEALSQSSTHRGNVFFFIDEFKLLPKLQHIDDALNFGRSLGVKVFAGLQSINQVYDGYGEEKGRAILSGFMNSFCFQTTDGCSRTYITERFGKNFSHYLYRAQEKPVSYQREGNTVEDWDVLDLPVGCAVVNLVGERPFLFQFGDFRSSHAIL